VLGAATSAGLDDGRVMRRQRSYDSAVDAILDLLSEGEPRPTAQQVAERSGLSIRSIFRLFEDVESLHAVAISRQVARVLPLIDELPETGSREERASGLVESRARFYEAVAPVRRFAVSLRASSPLIAEALDRSDRFFRGQLEKAFAAQLADREALEALDAATSWEMWDRLRSAQRLGQPSAKRVLRQLVLGLLESEGNAGGAT
jgi:AcrR family transcriptional regulator